MRSGSAHVRIKIVALLASLVALWGFAAFVTLREGLNLLTVATLDETVGRPAESLVDAMQQERRISVVYIANPTAERRQAIADQRSRTDAARQKFDQLARGEDARDAGSDTLDRRIRNVAGKLDQLDETRAAVDNGTLDRTQAAAFFSDIVSDTLLVFGALTSLDDPAIINDGRTLVEASHAREILSQEDALVTGVLAAGRLTPAEHTQFVKLVGAQRVRYAEVAAGLPESDRIAYEEFVKGDIFGKFRVAEDLLVDKGRVSGPLPLDMATWQATVDPVFAELRELVLRAADHLIERAGSAAIGVIIRISLAAGLGLIAVVASIIISITTARSLIRQLERLRDAAFALANERLPGVVDRIRRGDTVDVSAEAPPLAFGGDEVGQLGAAFNVVQETAIRTAVEQAEMRRSVRDVYLSLARRTQGLVHRQLTMLDDMERRENDPDSLDSLFRLDHLATRMRRNAENLIVLAGATAGRTWRRPVPMIDVIRAAVAEVEDYTRVTVPPPNPAGLAGVAAGDTAHLLAELIENATAFSPPHTRVQVRGQQVTNGYVVEVEDRGLGMSEEDLATANADLRAPSEFVLSSTVRLGLFVVGRLAVRHGIRVELRNSPYGGTTAIVLIPSALIIVTDPLELGEAAPGEPARPDLDAVEGAPAVPAAMTTAGRGGAAVLLAAPRPGPWPRPAPARRFPDRQPWSRPRRRRCHRRRTGCPAGSARSARTVRRRRPRTIRPAARPRAPTRPAAAGPATSSRRSAAVSRPSRLCRRPRAPVTRSGPCPTTRAGTGSAAGPGRRRQFGGAETFGR
ncbi:nitrate- and nitrite sensing domain-containing protein [Dactylosporangium sp. NBC_01737]|uniref:sensor histidine kinase n=1 Tax=Dactylosporangium sp. NBC_01737 TaxID=2975959 RepID=UPI002E13D9C3|nr:nitrate- and nitrite sensing domain-containing protein [Dactylosporangium sp. NBC_01737]